MQHDTIALPTGDGSYELIDRREALPTALHNHTEEYGGHFTAQSKYRNGSPQWSPAMRRYMSGNQGNHPESLRTWHSNLYVLGRLYESDLPPDWIDMAIYLYKNGRKLEDLQRFAAQMHLTVREIQRRESVVMLRVNQFFPEIEERRAQRHKQLDLLAKAQRKARKAGGGSAGQEAPGASIIEVGH